MKHFLLVVLFGVVVAVILLGGPFSETAAVEPTVRGFPPASPSTDVAAPTQEVRSSRRDVELDRGEEGVEFGVVEVVDGATGAPLRQVTVLAGSSGEFAAGLEHPGVSPSAGETMSCPIPRDQLPAEACWLVAPGYAWREVRTRAVESRPVRRVELMPGGGIDVFVETASRSNSLVLVVQDQAGLEREFETTGASTTVKGLLPGTYVVALLVHEHGGVERLVELQTVDVNAGAVSYVTFEHDETRADRGVDVVGILSSEDPGIEVSSVVLRSRAEFGERGEDAVELRLGRELRASAHRVWEWDPVKLSPGPHEAEVRPLGFVHAFDVPESDAFSVAIDIPRLHEVDIDFVEADSGGPVEIDYACTSILSGASGALPVGSRMHRVRGSSLRTEATDGEILVQVFGSDIGLQGKVLQFDEGHPRATFEVVRPVTLTLEARDGGRAVRVSLDWWTAVSIEREGDGAPALTVQPLVDNPGVEHSASAQRAVWYLPGAGRYRLRGPGAEVPLELAVSGGESLNLELDGRSVVGVSER